MAKDDATIDRREGRALFGLDPANYDAARPGYPAQLYERLHDRCGLGPGTRVLEIGPGPGTATRELVRTGAAVVAVEPDPALAQYLTERISPVDVRVAAFEDVALDDATFDLATAATSFHWIDQPAGLAKVARLLRSGGWWAGWWNVFGDPARADPFHDATQPWVGNLALGPGTDDTRPPFAIDVERRTHDLEAAGFTAIESEQTAWTLTLSTEQVRNLYATYSLITRLDAAEQEAVLTGVASVAAHEFGGTVERNMITVLSTARRPEPG